MWNILAFCDVLATLLTPGSQLSAPTVDLGYQVHKGEYNASTDLYKFRNIRYAQPPLGKLRFAAPAPPEGRSDDVVDGNFSVVCPQGSPAWDVGLSLPYQAWWAAGNASLFNWTAGFETLNAYLATNPPITINPATSEDCLFLDVVVPRALFDRYQKGGRPPKSGKGAPVAVWMYGGGYGAGNKDNYDGTGLIRAAKATHGYEIIFVTLNYRLGAFGFSSGPTFEAAGGLPNAGFYDQRLAIQWVSDNIHLFGGDPQRITLMGGSTLHQVTAFGGTKPVAFQQIIAQSPGFYPGPSKSVQEEVFQEFLALANISSFEEARAADSWTLITANARQIYNANYTTFVYNPIVDGTFVPALPSQLLAQGRHAHNIAMLVGHQQNEGPRFIRPDVADSDTAFRAHLELTFPAAPPGVIDHILTKVYPPVYANSTTREIPYTNPLDRAFLLTAELIFNCNAYSLLRSTLNQSSTDRTRHTVPRAYAYEFRHPPAVHAQDVPHTFYNGQGDKPAIGLSAAVAEVHQGYIASFVTGGKPEVEGQPDFVEWDGDADGAGKGKMMVWGGKERTGAERDVVDNERCVWWGKGEFYGTG